ncbi:MAG TPA: ATP-dependent metallopeptidase FtsH/Yme1/Tma family protein, partial [Acidimicrobiales bacterium]|nr:ATP-dependent metallopeptidase FtsH/Yme1/Tma family protein [Acidimicrobiales bacterium]
MKRIPRAALLYLVIGAAVLFVGIRFSNRAPEREEIDFSEFRQAIDDGDVATAEIKDQDHVVTGKLSDDTEYKVAFPAEYADELVDELHDADPPVEVTTDQQSDSLWTGILYSLLPTVLLIGAFLLVMNVVQGG